MPVVDRRVGLLFAIFLAALSVAFARALYLGTIKGGRLAQAAATQQVHTEEIPARRGTITDRKGRELAVSEPASDISANPRFVTDPVRAADRLAPLLEKDPEVLARSLARRDTGFVYLARSVPAARADRIHLLHIAGLSFEETEIRRYPQDYLASQVLGTVGRDDVGLSGLEYARQRQLAGSPGRRRTVLDAKGQPIKLRELKRAKPGARLELTLDSAIQSEAERVLQTVGATYRPKGASAIVMDPRSNEVLAMANWPRVDANDPSAAPSALNPTQNKATGFTYEPGSTFKAFTVAGALQDGKVTPSTQFTLLPQITMFDRTIHEAHPRGTEVMTTGDILKQSSNVGAVTIGSLLGKRRFDGWVRRFGFGKPTGIDLPGEEQGLVLPVSKYSGTTMANVPLGQGESVTPIQMATAYSAIANGGVLRPARVVRRVDGAAVARPKGRRVLSTRVAAQLRTMLEGVFAEGGTAHEVQIPGYKLAGKTGTANKFDAALGEYSESKYVASFVGFAPAEDPRLLVSVMVDEPQGSIFGGTVAAPAFGQITSFALRYLQIAPRR